MKLTERIYKRRTYFDGGIGTLLQKAGLPSGEMPENWNLTHPDVLRDIHLAYMNAGANVITSNTFGANCLKFDNLETMIPAAFAAMQEAKALFDGERSSVYLAFDMGPLGKMLEPLGDFPFEQAVECFAKSVRIAETCGFDLILIETMSDLYETKAAVLAAKENSTLPVFVTNAYDETGHLLTGANVASVVATLESLGVQALGANCSLGPQQMVDIARQYLEHASLPVIINPNAGVPRVENGHTVFDVDAQAFSLIMREIAQLGVQALGGCCGTTPEFIRLLLQKTADVPFSAPQKKETTVISSYTHAVTFGKKAVVIGERINPTGKPKLKDALRRGDLDYLVREGIAQQESGAEVLDVNVGLAEIDETATLVKTVKELQSVLNLPLQIDTVRASALEQALRIYNGKPLINSVNAKQKSMDTVFPLMQKYGGAVIALTIGEDGIPATAEGRCALAKTIIDEAARYGIDKKDIIVDPLCMAVSSDDNAGRVTLDAIRLIKRMGVKTCLGVSNISFALPDRPAVTAAFLAMALENGLDCAILNPCSDEIMRTLRACVMLAGNDAHCEDYIAFAAAHPRAAVSASAAPQTQKKDELPELMYAIVKGLSAKAAAAAQELLEKEDALQVIETQIIPALNLVGERFEKGVLFLPQLLMSAESANAAFSVAAQKLPQSEESRDRVLLATVQGDIHDIGKNIVKVLLQSYGFEVLDLGKDVPPQKVLEAALQYDVRLVGLSALMTTTLDSMQETVALLRERAPQVQTLVGGAVLTQDYADLIGATYYAKDAMQSVHFAKRVFGR
ncbi:MAG: homocysteine S-methyltransferase family protein [Clostridia bacterium]|nr:homocysteine S-methyltransferase family protein [Clostridia bacterium]